MVIGLCAGGSDPCVSAPRRARNLVPSIISPWFTMCESSLNGCGRHDCPPRFIDIPEDKRPQGGIRGGLESFFIIICFDFFR